MPPLQRNMKALAPSDWQTAADWSREIKGQPTTRLGGGTSLRLVEKNAGSHQTSQPAIRVIPKQAKSALEDDA